MLLLISVAIVGGFFWIYKQIQSSGEASGDSMSEIPILKIQTVTNGNVWVKNVGVGEIDLTKTRVYVNGQPVESTRSVDTIASGEMGGFTLGSSPCTKGSCTVRVTTGSASDTREVNYAELFINP